MNVFTPDAMKRSNFRTIRLGDLSDPKETADESFLFVFPSADLVNQKNGDGDLIEIYDCNIDFSVVYSSKGTHKTTPDTVIYVR